MSGIWPGDVRCVVMLTFDIDGVSGAINVAPESAGYPGLMSLREYGPSYLSNSELIAILLRVGSVGESVLTLASRVLATFNGLGGLGKATYGELCSLHSISDAKAPLLRL